MATVTKTITIDFARSGRKSITRWLEENSLKAESLTTLTITVSAEANLSDFEEDELRDWADENYTAEMDVIERAYRYMAEGDIQAAMDELHREFGLAPPPAHARHRQSHLRQGGHPC